MTGSLDGLRVLDFGQYVAGPLTGMLLADQGANVIRVDPPGGPRWTTPANATWNRGKRSIVMNLDDPADLDAARALIARADVLIENFRPGVMDRLGLGFAAASAANRGLVYCSLPGFAAADSRAGVPAWEGVLGAATGTYVNRLGLPPRDVPAVTALPLSSSYGAFLGACSIAMALNARARDGIGQHIEVPLFDATFTAVGMAGLKLIDAPPSGRGGLGTPWVRQYECGDGRWVQFFANPTRHRTQFVHAAGVFEDWSAAGLLDHGEVSGDQTRSADLMDRMVALFKTRAAAEWEELVNAAGTPCAICRESAQWLNEGHALASRAVIDVDDPGFGRMRQPGIHPRLDATSGAVRTPAPRLDEHRNPILAEAADRSLVRADTGEDQAPPTPALDGVRVLDLCIILAGPTCGRTLAEFGADVIKIDDPNREGGIASHLDVNRGKRSLLLDLKTEAGRNVFWRLLDDSDVVLQNYRAGAMERLGLGYEAIRARKPDIVYASLNAYGHGGPWQERPGWEHLAQAATGMQMRFGDTRPELQPFPVNDYATGILGAYAVALALHHRNRTGEGQHVRSALAYTATLLQSPFMQAYDGKVWDEPRGVDTLGTGPWQRLYAARDGWFYLGAHRAQAEVLLESLGVDAASTPAGSIESILEAHFATVDVDAAVASVLAVGAGAHRVASVEDNMAGEWLTSRGVSITRRHDGPGRVRTTGPSAKLSRTPVSPGAPASAPGSDGAGVLEEVGLSSVRAELVAAGIMLESL